MRKTLHLLAVLHVLSIVIIVNSTPSTKGFVLQELPLYGTRRTKPTAFSADDVTNKCQQEKQENSNTEDRRNSKIVSRLMFPKSDQNRERSFNMASLMNNYQRLHNKMPMKQFDKVWLVFNFIFQFFPFRYLSFLPIPKRDFTNCLSLSAPSHLVHPLLSYDIHFKFLTLLLDKVLLFRLVLI